MLTVATFTTATTPRFPVVSIPTLPSVGLTDAEKNLVSRRFAVGRTQAAEMELCNAYYEGLQRLTNLGIAIPKELEGLRTIVGWPAMAVDPIEDRLTVEGFRRPGSVDIDLEVQDQWDGNGMGGEQSLAHLDALSMGSGWVTIGTPDDDSGLSVIRVESPLNMAALWDARTLTLKSALQTYLEDDALHAALYQPGLTVYLATDENGVWQLVRRDEHGYDGIPVERLANRARSSRRDGASEITPAVRSLTDAACRSLLQLAVAGEFYSIPRYLILGATEKDFQDQDGNPVPVWETYINTINALERDENGDVPTVTQLTAYDPSVFTRVLDWYAAKMAGMLRATPQDLGIYTEGNPPSADAVQFADSRRDRYARRKQAAWGPVWSRVAQHSMRMVNGGKLPAGMDRLEADWAPVSMPSLGAVGNFIAQAVPNQVLPPTADVLLKMAGLTAVQRAQVARERRDHASEQALTEIGNRFLNPAKTFRVDGG